MGVLSPTVGTWDRPVACIVKALDNVAPGWLGCLWAVAAVASLVWEVTPVFGPRFDCKSPT